MEWQNNVNTVSLNEDDKLPALLIANLSSWKAIIVTGDDKKNYLQGQVTCDVVKLESNQSTLGSQCDAKGKVWSIFRLFNHNEGYALFQHGSAIDTSLTEIKKYAVFSKVDIHIIDNIALGVLGHEAQQFIDKLSEQTGNVRSINGGTAVKIEENRWLLLLDSHSALKLVESLPETLLSDESVWDKCDIEAAVPRITQNNQNEYIPQAFNLHSLDAISFSKGCYTGQETVARAKYRGTNKRSMFIVEGKLKSSDDSLIQLERSVGENWRSAGSLMAHYQYADGTSIGLIVLPNNLDLDTKLRQVNEPNSDWHIKPLPYSIDE